MSKCKQCGECCRYIDTFYSPFSEEIKEWLIVRGHTIVQEEPSYIQVRIYHPCPELQDNKCKLHGKKKPKICKEYPTKVEIEGLDMNKTLMEGCGYKQ